MNKMVLLTLMVYGGLSTVTSSPTSIRIEDIELIYPPDRLYKKKDGDAGQFHLTYITKDNEEVTENRRLIKLLNGAESLVKYGQVKWYTHKKENKLYFLIDDEGYHESDYEPYVQDPEINFLEQTSGYFGSSGDNRNGGNNQIIDENSEDEFNKNRFSFYVR